MTIFKPKVIFWFSIAKQLPSQHFSFYFGSFMNCVSLPKPVNGLDDK
jgi:hypothetical protein